MTKRRREAFSDGVLAIIITIMVLELSVPHGHEWADLGALWPKFLSYALSFVYVAIYWNNHHHLLHATRTVNGAILWANLHLLFWLSLFPFVTAWAGESGFEPIPMASYSAVALMAAVAYAVLHRSLVRADPENAVLVDATRNSIKMKVSIAAYLVGFVAPLFGGWGSWVTGAVLVGIALMWIVPDQQIERAIRQAGEGPTQKPV